MLQRLMQWNATLPMGRDPVWGNAGIDEVVTARLGAMGVV